MPKPRFAIIAPLALCLAVGPALAQTAAPAAPTVTPAPNCEKPGDPPGKGAPELRVNSWTKSSRAYLDCLKNFVAEQQAAAEPHIKAANAAVAEYNAAVKEFNEALAAARQ